MSEWKITPLPESEVRRMMQVPPVPVAPAERIADSSRWQMHEIIKRAHEQDAGFDLRWVPEDGQEHKNFRLKPVPHLFGTGVRVAIPEGFMGEIRPRSGLSAKGVHVALGTIDASYRGECMVTLSCPIAPQYVLEPYERVAQLVIVPVYRGGVEFVSELPETVRGANGHGSTGRF